MFYSFAGELLLQLTPSPEGITRSLVSVLARKWFIINIYRKLVLTSYIIKYLLPEVYVILQNKIPKLILLPMSPYLCWWTISLRG